MTTAAPPRPPESDELVALIEEARRRARRRRRRVVAALTLLAVVVGGAYVLLVETAGDPTTSPARSPRAAASPPPVAVGRFWYTRTISSGRFLRPAGGILVRHGFSVGRGPQVAFDVTTSVETWTGVSGTARQRTVVLSERFASAADRRRWVAYHRTVPNFGADIDSDTLTIGNGMFPATEPPSDPLGPQDIGDGAFSYRQLLALPAQPAVLRRRVDRAFAALARRQARTALDRCGNGGGAGCAAARPVPGWERRDNLASGEIVEIAQVLSWPISARLRLALVQAAMTLPSVSSDVTVNLRARDQEGRSGMAVTLTPPRYPGHFEPDPMGLIFDTAGRVLVQPGFETQGRVTAQGFVSSAYGVPRGVSPIPTHDGLGAPPAVSIRPAVGKPATVFKVEVTGVSRATVSSQAPRLGDVASGPVFPGCASGFRKPTPPSTPPTLSFPGSVASATGRPTYTYLLKPPVGTAHAWCPGRYQLQIYLPSLGAPGPTGVGTSVYFEVK